MVLTANAQRVSIALRAAFGVFVAAALASCSSETEAPADSTNPLLYEITSPSGEIEGWMLGTIHLLPDGTPWRTDAINDAVNRADMVIVEVADLGNRQRAGQVFAQLGTTHGLPSLAQRVPPSKRDTLNGMIKRSGFSPDSFNAIETWAAALMLAQSDSLGEAENGVDRAVIADFSDREVREFEGTFAQLSIFDSLAEEDQRVLLTSVVVTPDRAEAEAKDLLEAWLSGNENALEEATLTGALKDQQVRDALLVDRNRAWMKKLLPVLDTDAKPLVAVGAAHLVGEQGLAALLEADGYTVRRITR